MPTLTHDQLAALARASALNREIEATLGRAMNEDERAVVDRARVLWRLSREAKRHKAKLGSSDRHTAITAERSKVDRVPCEDPKRRERLEADPIAWLRWYMSGTFTRPFERPHTEIVAGVMRAHETRGRFVVAAERGIGKALALDTPLPTPTGWTTIGAVQVGDQVFDDAGKPCEVIAKSEVFKDRPVYAVEVNKERDTIIADSDHVWVAEMDRRKGFRQYTTQQIAEPTNVSQSRAAVNVAAPLDLPAMDLSAVDPYFLGLWLGDGSRYAPSITTADNETVEWLGNYAANRGMTIRDAVRNGVHQVFIRQHKLSGRRTIDPPAFLRTAMKGKHNANLYQCACGKQFMARTDHVRSGATRGCGCLLRNPLKDALESLGVLNNKHIPTAYLRAGTAQRMELLRGLIDTDGHVTESGGVEFCNTNRRLADGVVELVRTLGVKAFFHEDRARVNGKDCGPRYRVTFHMAGCATIPRKAARCRDAGTMTRHYLHATPCGTADTVCIQVSAASGMFLAGRSMTPTHNSSILWAMILYLKLSGRQMYPVCVPWADKALKRAFRFWKNALCFNDRLGTDYPEFCAPFRHSRGVAQRVMTTTWRDTGSPTGAQLTVGEGMIVLPDRLGAIGGSTINGNIRGLNHPQDDGTVLRPSIALLDDVQDRQTAKSPVQVADTAAIIDGDVAGCGDPGRDMPMLMACNCIAPGDVSEHYLANQEWHALRVPCIESWPAGWDDPKSKCQKLWTEWHERFRAGKGDLTFYRENKKEMTAGMKLSAPAAFKGAEKCPDAFYGVMRMYYRMGHEAFMAERQQSPVDPIAEAQVRVTPDMIVKRAIGPARGTAPEGSVRIIGGADINPGISGRLGARITWAVGAFQMHQSECVMAYGIKSLDMPSNPTPSQQVTCVYNGLSEIRIALSAMGCEALIYDARGWYDKGVTRGQALRYAGIPLPTATCAAIPAEGWPHQAYRPTHKTAIRAFEGCHLSRDRVEQQVVKWIAWDADWFNLQQLRAWLAAPGAPGSCILHAGQHSREFLNQITTRAFIGMVQKHSGPVYDWARQPGNDDYGDCLAMCRVGASYYGIGTGETTPQRVRKRYSQKDFSQ